MWFLKVLYSYALLILYFVSEGPNRKLLTLLQGLINNLISIGLGRESAFSAAVLGDNMLMEKAWQDTGMLAEAVLHAHAHGRPTLKNLVQAWNKTLQKEVEQAPSSKTDAASAFLASLEDPKLTSLSDASKKPPIEILPPGMSSIFASITATKKPLLTQKTSQQEPNKPLALEDPTKPLAIEAPPSSEPTQTESAPETAAVAESPAPETAGVAESTAPETAAEGEPAAPVDGPVTETVSEPPPVKNEETSLEEKSDPSSTPTTETAAATEDNSQTTPPPPPETVTTMPPPPETVTTTPPPPETVTTTQPPPETVTTTVKPAESAAAERQEVSKYPPIRSQPIDFDFLNG